LLEDISGKGHVVSDCVNMGYFVEFFLFLLEGVGIDCLLENYGFLYVF